MRRTINAKRLECLLDNPLNPTFVTIGLPPMKVLINEAISEFKAHGHIDIEVDRPVNRPKDLQTSQLCQTKLKFNPESKTLEAKEPHLGLEFKIGLSDSGDVQSVQAFWT